MVEAFTVAAVRPADGRRNGRLSGWHSADLEAQVLDAPMARTDCDPALVEDMIMGCVGQIDEQAGNIVREAVLASRLPESVPETSVGRQCGSSQQALHFAAQAVMSSSIDVLIAAGVERMSQVPINTPMSLPAKNGMGFYVSPTIQRRYPDVQFSQFMGAEMQVRKHGLDMPALDAFALQSHQRAAVATRAGAVTAEIVQLAVRINDGSLDGQSDGELHAIDEGIRFDATLEGIASVKLLQQGGALTAASASQICDGAAGLMVVNERGRKALGVAPLARMHPMTVLGQDPVIMLDAPAPATARALQKASMSIDEIDLFEVEEAFARLPLAWLLATDAAPVQLNVNGGAIALGQLLGGSGARQMNTLVHGLQARGKRDSPHTLCEGGGVANVTINERL